MLVGLLLMLGGLFLMYWGYSGLKASNGISKGIATLPKA